MKDKDDADVDSDFFITFWLANKSYKWKVWTIFEEVLGNSEVASIVTRAFYLYYRVLP